MNVWIQKHQSKCNFPIGSRVKFGTGAGEVVDHLFSWSSLTPHSCSILISLLLDSGMIHYVHTSWLQKE